MGLKKNLPVVQRPNKHLARRADGEVTLVSRDNFLLFMPMLHEVASGDLNPSDIVNPIRRMLKAGALHPRIIEARSTAFVV
jgi:NADH dehydrogenase FAD-containing subunit